MSGPNATSAERALLRNTVKVAAINPRNWQVGAMRLNPDHVVAARAATLSVTNQLCPECSARVDEQGLSEVELLAVRTVVSKVLLLRPGTETRGSKALGKLRRIRSRCVAVHSGLGEE